MAARTRRTAKPGKVHARPARKTSGPKARPKRLRRSAEAAHELILDAAERRLEQAGPRGIRLQEIAADVGVSHPTILHHFGTREALVEAVVSRALGALQGRILARIGSEGFEATQASDLFAHVFATLGDRGHARLMAWLALEGRTGEDPDKMLRTLAQVMHARREVETKKAQPFEDTLFTVLLVAHALFSESVLGDAMLDSAGLEKDATARERFHSWLIRLIEEHLHS